MANVNITAGTGTIITTDVVTADSSNAQVVQLGEVAAGVLTRTPLNSQVGPVTETAPATDTASSGLNGRLQRVAQRLTSLIALLPTALGAGGGLKIDGSGTALPVSQPGLGGGILQTVTTVGTTAVTVPATPLAGRATMLVQNVGATTIYLGKSTVTADTTATGGTQLLAGQSVPISLAAAVLLYAISSATGGLVSTLEAAA